MASEQNKAIVAARFLTIKRLFKIKNKEYDSEDQAKCLECLLKEIIQDRLIRKFSTLIFSKNRKLTNKRICYAD